VTEIEIERETGERESDIKREMGRERQRRLGGYLHVKKKGNSKWNIKVAIKIAYLVINIWP
jgi:hypothetical protein